MVGNSFSFCKHIPLNYLEQFEQFIEDLSNLGQLWDVKNNSESHYSQTLIPISVRCGYYNLSYLSRLLFVSLFLLMRGMHILGKNMTILITSFFLNFRFSSSPMTTVGVSFIPCWSGWNTFMDLCFIRIPTQLTSFICLLLMMMKMRLYYTLLCSLLVVRRLLSDLG